MQQSMEYYEHQSSDNLQAAQRLARQIDHELVDLIDYLRRALSFIQTNEELIKYSETGAGVPSGYRKSKIRDLLERTQKLRDLTMQKAEHVATDWSNAIQNLWQEAKHSVSQVTGFAAEKQPSSRKPASKKSVPAQLWTDLFQSRDWHQFFRKHPNLDPEEWKDYLKDNLGDPAQWRHYIEESLAEYVPHPMRDYGIMKQPYRETYRYQYPTGGMISDYSQPFGHIESGKPVAAIHMLPVSMMYSAVSLVYVCALFWRLWFARSKASIYIGDGTLELLGMTTHQPQSGQQQHAETVSSKVDIEKRPLWHPVNRLRRSVQSFRTFVDTMFLPMILLPIMEIRGTKPLYMHLFYMGILVPTVLAIERQVKKTGGGQLFYYSMGMLVGLFALSAYSVTSLLEYSDMP